MNAVPPVCDNCGGPHIAPECPLPRDEEKCKKACEARLKAQAGRGGQGGGRGGRGGRGGGHGVQNKQGQWLAQNSKSENKASTPNQGVECINGV